MKRSTIITIVCVFVLLIVSVIIIWFVFKINSQPPEMSLQAIVDQDTKTIGRILFNTKHFFRSRNASEKIIALVTNVTNYVPDLDKPNQKQFWMQTVKPILAKCVFQHHISDDVIYRTFFNINKAATLMLDMMWDLLEHKLDRERRDVIKAIVNKSIDLIKESHEEVVSLQQTALSDLSQITYKIVDMIGPEFIRCLNDLSEFEIEMNKLEEELAFIWFEIEDATFEYNYYYVYMERLEKELKSRRDKASHGDINEDQINEFDKQYISQQIIKIISRREQINMRRVQLSKLIGIKEIELKNQKIRLTNKKKESDETKNKIQSKYGISGVNLIQVLVNLKAFPHLISRHHFAPLVSILKGSKIIIEYDLTRLENTPNDKLEWIVEQTIHQLMTLCDTTMIAFEELSALSIQAFKAY